MIPTGTFRRSTHAGPRGRERDDQNEVPADGAPGSPPSFAQERYWYLDHVEGGEAVYAVPFALRMRGALDRRALERSVDLIRQRHDILRTTLRRVGGELRQVVAPFESAALALEDLTGARRVEAGAILRESVTRTARRPFDFESGPLVRFRLFHVAPRDHLLLVVAHHAILDFRSFQVLGEEIGRLYGALVRGETIPPAEPRAPYARFAARQRSELAGEEGARLLAYWRDRLRGAPPAPELPRDRDAPTVRGRPGAGVDISLSAADVNTLALRSRAGRTTPFVTLLAGFQALLLRYTGQTDLCIGSMAEGRTRSDEEAVPGPFLNTVVLRTDLSGDPTFRELLRRASATVFGALDHQDLPFDQLERALRAERGAESGPLFNVLFRAEGTGRPPELPGILTESVQVERGATYSDLDMVVRASPGGTMLTLRFDTDLFDRATVVRMTRHYHTLLRGALFDPDRRLSELPLMEERERRCLLSDWNDTEAPGLADDTIPDLIERQAARSPRAIAVQDDAGGALDYRDLEGRAGRLAERLRELGVGAGDVVGLAARRTVALPVALLGILKTGACYLPLDADLPTRRLDYMLRDAGARTVLACGASAPGLSRLEGVSVHTLEELDPGPSSGTPHRPGAARPHAPAYVIYTSGSTGRPKGVVVHHGAVANFLGAMRRAPGIEADDRLLALTTLGFDSSVLEILLPLTVGATTVLASRDATADGRTLLALLREQRITLLQGTPATWRLLIDAGWDGDPPLKALCGGEAMSPTLAGELRARASEVWNLYGPTETTVWSTRLRLQGEESPVPIGRPIENTRVYVLDGSLAPVPVGIRGELYIGGAGVSVGYHGRPDLDGERFVPDPFSRELGDRLYRTGDLARWRGDGSLVWLGRNDDQVKIRGFRIELGEVEAALSRIDDLASSVAAIRTDHLGDQRLVAYVVPRRPGTVIGSEIRARLRESLPRYMVPSLIVELDALPVTPNGKIDRSRLPDPLAIAASADAHRAPSTPTERTIARIWGELLGVDDVGADDSFFDLGGHSLLSVRALHRIEEETGARLELRAMVLQTLSEMAAAVDARTGSRPPAQAHPVR